MNIEKIINDWDPYSVFPFAPKDEYQDEINKIKNHIKRNQSLDGLTKYLEKIFEDEKKDFFKIAKKILD